MKYYEVSWDGEDDFWWERNDLACPRLDFSSYDKYDDPYINQYKKEAASLVNLFVFLNNELSSTIESSIADRCRINYLTAWRTEVELDLAEDTKFLRLHAEILNLRGGKDAAQERKVEKGN